MQRIRLAGMIVVLVLVGVACGSGDDKATTTPTATASGNAVEVVDSEFKPKAISVTAGTEVVWTQTGSQMHSVTADDGSFDSSPGCLGDQAKCMKSGSTFEHTFATAGTFKYYCVIHGGKGGAGMSGTITVTA